VWVQHNTATAVTPAAPASTIAIAAVSTVPPASIVGRPNSTSWNIWKQHLMVELLSRSSVLTSLILQKRLLRCRADCWVTLALLMRSRMHVDSFTVVRSWKATLSMSTQMHCWSWIGLVGLVRRSSSGILTLKTGSLKGFVCRSYKSIYACSMQILSSMRQSKKHDTMWRSRILPSPRRLPCGSRAERDPAVNAIMPPTMNLEPVMNCQNG